MTTPILNVNGHPILSSVNQNALHMVEQMLCKEMPITSKLELCKLIISQYRAIEQLVEALIEADPDHKLVKGLRSKPGSPKSGVGPVSQ